MALRLLVVSTTDRTRGPLAAALLADAAQRAGLAADVASRGVAVRPWQRPSWTARRAGRDLAMVRHHLSQQVQIDEITAADLVLCLEPAHLEALTAYQYAVQVRTAFVWDEWLSIAGTPVPEVPSFSAWTEHLWARAARGCTTAPTTAAPAVHHGGLALRDDLERRADRTVGILQAFVHRADGGRPGTASFHRSVGF